MADRDKYGNYVNDEGVTIKVSTDKNGNDHIGFYEGPVYEKDNHKGVHVNIDYEKGNGHLILMMKITKIRILIQIVVS